jgi:hypothetical protein
MGGPDNERNGVSAEQACRINLYIHAYECFVSKPRRYVNEALYKH